MSLYDETLYSNLLDICYGKDIHEKVISVRAFILKHFSDSDKTGLCEKLLEDGIPPCSVAFYAGVEIEKVKQVINDNYLQYESNFNAKDPIAIEIQKKWEEKISSH